MLLDRVRAVADAVLLEGYLLYPYRASAPKNRYRFQFGVLAPRDWSEAGGCEAWWLESQTLLHGARAVSGVLRTLQLVRRRIERASAGSPGGFCATESLEVDDRLHLAWDEGAPCEVPFELSLAPAGEVAIPFTIPGGSETELVRDANGAPVGRVIRTRSPIHGRILAGAEALGDRLTRLRVRVENHTPWTAAAASRDQVLAGALLATHLLLAADEHAFVSLLDPPGWARAAAAGCANVRTYPVLAGDDGRRDLVLSAPIILHDHPQVAPESPGDSFDATEIDELLALRTATLTPEEKRQARATDERAAAIVDRADHLPPAVMAGLHGAIRELRAEPIAAPAHLAPGRKVRLRPGRRRTDAQDLLYAGLTATIERVLADLEGQTLLCVTIDEDPAAELHRWYGRFHYYYPDEVEPMAPPAEEA